MPEPEAQHETVTPDQPPGHLLRQARERLGLEQKDIAAQLNLQTGIIDALENNDEEQLPAAAYVRGYLRAYARIVKLNPEMLIGLYEQAPSPPPEITPNIRKSAPSSSRDRPLRAVTYMITFIMALLLLAWLHDAYFGQRPGADDGQVATGPEPSAEQSAPAAPPPGLRLETAPGPSLDLPQPLYGDEPAPETTDFYPATEDLPAIITAVPDPVPPVVEEETPPATPEEATLELRLIRDSWIQVKNADKVNMYEGLARAGREIHLSGQAPFQVILGYAPGVEVTFNQERFDTAPHTSAGIARFTLGDVPHE